MNVKKMYQTVISFVLIHLAVISVYVNEDMN